MKTDLMWMSIIVLVFLLIIIYYDHIKMKSIFSEAKVRINKIYDNVKSFIVLHFIDTTISDSNSDTEDSND
jgi:hypothetical protein